METRYHIIYFSGTGNSRMAGSVLHRKLNEAGLLSSICQVSQNASLADADILIFVFPVYALVAPRPIKAYIKGLPAALKGKKAILLATIGQMDLEDSVPGCEGIALTSLGNILHKKGIEVVMSNAIAYPENLGIVTGGPKPDEESAIINESNRQVMLFGEEIIHEKFSLKEKPGAPLTLGSRLFGAAFMLFGRHFIGKSFTASNDCNSCGVCVRKCPAGAISLGAGKPYWNWSCEGCLGCFNTCPKNAIRISLVKVIISCIPLFIPWHKLVTTFIQLENHLVHTMMAICTWIFLCLAATCLLIEIVDHLGRIPLIGKFFRLAVPLPYRQYQAK